MVKKLVITGVSRGLGRYLYEELAKSYHVLGITRDTKWNEIAWDDFSMADAVIHCAFNSKHEVTTDVLAEYVDDNILFLDSMVKSFVCRPETKFIYMSSVQVYSCMPILHTESDIMNLDQVDSTYGRVKLMAESIVKKHLDNYLIMRLPSILGKYMKHNSLVKAVTGGDKLSLSANSTNNYVTYSEVMRFIDKAVQEDVRGIYNFVANNYLDIANICRMFNNNPQFGNHYYSPPRASNRKLVDLDKSFDRTSEQSILEFAKVWESAS